MISHSDLIDLFNRHDIQILEVHKNGPKVLETAEGKMIKIFYKKNGLSSNCFRPYALRFYKNAEQLQKLAFNAPNVREIKYCSDIDAHVIYYDKLPGETVTQLVKKGNDALLKKVIIFLSELHQKGVFFRAIHLSNLLYQDDRLSLLDIADLKIKRSALSLYDRYRNLRHFFSNTKDFPLWGDFSLEERLAIYSKAARLSELKTKLLTYFILKKVKGPR